MLWVFISCCVVVYCVMKFITGDMYDRLFASTFCLLCAFPALLILMSGITTYPKLLADKAYIETMENSIEMMRKARYDTTANGTFVGGSLDNVNQSTNLSGYLDRYIQAKAKYNEKLTLNQTAIDMISAKLFTDIAFVSPKIRELEILK